MKFSFASATSQHYSNSTSVTQIDLPTGTGMMGILPQHVPTLGVLAAGWATVYESSGQNKRFFVSSGSYAINEDGSIQIAAEEAIAEADIDMEAAKKNWLLPRLNLLKAPKLKKLKLKSPLRLL